MEGRLADITSMLHVYTIYIQNMDREYVVNINAKYIMRYFMELVEAWWGSTATSISIWLSHWMAQL